MVDINQFAMTPDQGSMDLQFNGSVVSGAVSQNQATSLIAGQAVKIEDAAAGVPQFLAITAATDPVFGFAVYNLKDAAYKTGAPLEIAMRGSVMYMTANAAIARGARVEIAYATNKVAPSGGVNPVIGFAYDKAAADGDLIRVYIEAPTSTGSASTVRTAQVTATLAEINAGKTIIAGTAGKKIRVVGFTERVTGAFTTTTSVDLQSSNGTPVKVAVAAVAALTSGAVLVPGSANVTLGAGYAADLGVGDGLVVANVGTAAAGGTSIQYTVLYQLTD